MNDDEGDHGVRECDVQVGRGQLHGQKDCGDRKDKGRVTNKPVGPVENRSEISVPKFYTVKLIVDSQYSYFGTAHFERS